MRPLSFNARFGGVPMNVYVPMAAVVAIYAKENAMGMGFGIEPGAELYAQMQTEPDPEPPKPEKKRPKLQVCKVAKTKKRDRIALFYCLYLLGQS